MNNRKYNSLKKKLLQGDKQAFHELYLSPDEEVNERTLNDAEIMAYLEEHEIYEFLTDEEKEVIEKAKELIAKYCELIEEYGGNILNAVQDISNIFFAAVDAAKEAQPYLDEILKRPEYANLTPRQLLTEKHTDENGEEYTIFQRIREEIREKKENKASALLPVLHSKKADDLHKPTDKISGDLTQPMIRDKLLAQGQQRFLMAHTKNGAPVPVTLSMQMDAGKLAALGVKDYITPIDITIMQAMSTIFVNEDMQRKTADKGKPVYFTPNRLWLQMGARSKLSTENKAKLENYLQKLGTTWVELDASKLLNEYKRDGEATGRRVRLKNTYKGNLIHVDIRQHGIVDGKENDSIITLYADPIIMEFARAIDQITAVPLYVQQATGTLNDDNLAIANYLQSQIAWIKNDPKRNKTINLETLKEKTGTIKRDKALKAYIEQLLTDYANPPKGKNGQPIQAAWIEGFSIVPTGYRIKISSPDKIEDKKVSKKITDRKKKPEK